LTGGTTLLGCTPCSGNAPSGYAAALTQPTPQNYASCAVTVAATGAFGTISSVVCSSTAYFSAANTCSACAGAGTLTTTYPTATTTTTLTLVAGLSACSTASGSYTAISSWTCATGYVIGLTSGGATNSFMGCYPCDGTGTN
jgi:hypothetical protein